MLALLSVIMASAWFYASITDRRELLTPGPVPIQAADGDSFVIAGQKIRLKGIDALEYGQTCQDATGKIWACGAEAHKALSSLLNQPGLSCETENHDRFGRALATCFTIKNKDIAAAQVRAGMAVSNEFNGMRDYGEEEDAARIARSGIWQGAFMLPKEWRKQHTHLPSAQ